jgi:predicted secreted acid phosphatase
MKCPYLAGTYFQWCQASKECYVPSQFEFNEYCTRDGYKVCPGYYKATYEREHEGNGNRERLVSNDGG